MASKATLCALCVQMAYLRAFGFTNEEVAARICTDDHPSGVAERTIYKHQKDHKTTFDAIDKWCQLNKREQAVSAKELNAKTIREEMEAKLGKSWAAVENAIESGDTATAVWHIEQVIGKAKGNLDVKHSGGVLHGHVAVQQSEQLTAKQAEEIAESQAMVRALLTGAVQDAELVDA